jgi:hypothetical protein
LIDWNSIPRTERNSLSLRQLVQPGCQNAFNGAVSGIARFLHVGLSRLSLTCRAAASSTALAGRAADRYNPAMRRPQRLALASAFLIVLVFGAYTAFWFFVAGRIADGIGQWAGTLRSQNLDLSWHAIRVAGFPFSFRAELGEATLRDAATGPSGELTMPLLTGSAHPWNFRLWRLAAPRGLTATAGPTAPAGATLTADTARGSVAVGGDGGATIWLGLDNVTASSGIRLAARDADLWLNLPPPAQTHGERTLGIALDVRELTLPAVPAPFHSPLDEVSLGVTVRGELPAAPLRRAAAAWRDAGGTIDLDRFALRWGELAITGSGTLALDNDLQPMGSFSGAIAGYQQLLAALVAAGRMRAGDARLVGLALGVMAKSGPDGKPELSVPFTVQDGQMYLGPAKLGPAPRIDWQ